MDSDAPAARDDGSATKWFGSGGSVVHEYLVDILGGLVPGILLVVGTAFSLLAPLFDVYRALAPQPPTESGQIVRLVQALAQLPSTPLFFGCIGVALMTYVAGHIFYRRDPKVPDQSSFRVLERQKVVQLLVNPGPSASGTRRRQLPRVFRRWFYQLRARFSEPRSLLTRDKDKVALNEHLTHELGAPSAEECQFPYPNFADYLRKRGFGYLKPLAGWSEHEDTMKPPAGESKHRDTRSKLWVNVLKVRLMLHFPQKYRQIVRNEAHIRLASGTWYVAGALRNMALFGLCLVAAVVLASDLVPAMPFDWNLVSRAAGQHFWTILSPLSVLWVSWYLRRKIDGFYHYQRMREVDWVLETAFTAFRDQPQLLSPPFTLPTGPGGPAAPAVR